MKVVDTLKQKCKELLSSNISDPLKISRLNTISEILSEANALVKLDPEMVLNILTDLGYNRNEIVLIYSEILKGH